MSTNLQIFQIILTVLLTVFVLVQSREGGLSSTVSGGAGYRSKRGLERVIFYSTAIVGTLFSLNSLCLVLIAG